MTSALCFVAAAALTFVATPGAIMLARRTDFYDQPLGYKGHGAPTPYLGGVAVIGSFLVVATVLSGAAGRFETALGCAVVLWLISTIDDRFAVPPQWRLLAEISVAVLLYERGLGWSITHDGLADLTLTIVWVVGLTNAFNLMDNLDGAASTVAAVSCAGIGALALADHSTGLAALAFALSGACVGFLRHNLAGPARIFLGDGGSMPLGMLTATLAMAAGDGAGLGASAPLAAGLLVGLPILDTTLVSVSRWRREVSLLTGGRDHLTHRLLTRVGSPRAVACCLALAQAALCVAAIAGEQIGTVAVQAIASVAVVAGIGAIAVLESPAWRPATVPLALRVGRRSLAPVVPAKVKSGTIDNP